MAPMRRADSGVTFDHAQGPPAAFLPDGFEIDARHDAPASPVVAPIMDTKISDTCAFAGRSVRFLDRRAAWQAILARIGIGFANPVLEDASHLGATALDVKPMQLLPDPRMHGDGARFTVLGFRKDEQRIRTPIDMDPVKPKGFADTEPLEAESHRNGHHMACVAAYEKLLL